MKNRKEAAKALHLLLMGNLMSGDNFRMWSAARELAHFTEKNANLFTKEEISTIAGKASTATDDVLEELLRTSLDNLGLALYRRSEPRLLAERLEDLCCTIELTFRFVAISPD